MARVKMFEDLPEGFRLATNNPVDVKLVALTYAQAFAELPHIYPVPSTEVSSSARLKFWYADAEVRIPNTIEYGYVLTNEDYSAVMLVVPYEDALDNDGTDLVNILRENATEADAQNLLAIFNNIGEAEADMPWYKNTIYIEIIAVQPPRQGQKECSRLMRKLFEECERLHLNISLITHSDRDESIYKHFGFVTMDKRVDEENNSTCYFMLKTFD